MQLLYVAATEIGADMMLKTGCLVVLWLVVLQSFWLSLSDTPAVTKPPITKTIPAYLNQAKRLLRKIVERIPKKSLF